LGVEGEVFAAEGGVGDELGVGAIGRRLGDFEDMVGLVWVIFGDGVAGDPVDLGGAAQGFGGGFDQLGESGFGGGSGLV